MSHSTASLSGLGMSLFDKLGVGNFTRKDAVFDSPSGVLTATNLGDLGRKLKYSKGEKIRYSSNGFSFVLGDEPMPAQMSDDEKMAVHMMVEDFGSARLVKSFNDSFFSNAEPSADERRAAMEYSAVQNMGLVDLLKGKSWYDSKVDGQAIDRMDVLDSYGIRLGSRDEIMLDGKYVGMMRNGVIYSSKADIDALIGRFEQMESDPAFKASGKIKRAVGEVIRELPVIESRVTDEEMIRRRIESALPYMATVKKRRYLRKTDRIDESDYKALFHDDLGGYDRGKIRDVLKQMAKDNGPYRHRLQVAAADFDAEINMKKYISLGALGVMIPVLLGAYTQLGNITNPPTPTPTPTPEPTVEPTLEPTVQPTVEPTVKPTPPPTTQPTVQPTVEPTEIPSGIEGELHSASSLFRQLDRGTKDVVVSVANANGSSVPGGKNLAIIALNQISMDPNVADKAGMAKEAFNIYAISPLSFQKMPQIQAVNNATGYFGTADALTSEIDQAMLLQVLNKLGSYNINSGFTNQRQHASMVRLGSYTPEITDWPGDWKEAVGQIEEIVYKNNYDKVNGDRYVWDNVIDHAVDFIMKQRADGKITAPDGEIDVLHAQLFQIDLLTGAYTEKGRDSDSACLAVAVKNVGPNATHSPLKQVADIVEEHYTNREKNIDWCFEKWSAYDIAKWMAYGRGDDMSLNWPNCNVKYQENLDKISDRIVFTIGEPFVLRGNFTSLCPSEMKEQLIPQYTNLLAYMSGIKSRVDTAIYPSGSQFYHNEPSFYIDGKWFSFYDNFGNYDTFKSDYGENQAPILLRSGTDGKDKNLNL